MPTLPDARESGLLVERVIHGVTYSYLGAGDSWQSSSWIEGHEYATMKTVYDRTGSTAAPAQKRLATRTWLVAQMYWWGLWQTTDGEVSAGVTRQRMDEMLHKKVSCGAVLEVHPSHVWASLKNEWNAKFGSDAICSEDTSGGSPSASPRGVSKRVHDDENDTEKENQPIPRRIKLSDVDFRDSWGEYKRGSTCLYASATPAQIAEANAQMLKTELDLNAHLRSQLDAEFHDEYRDLVWEENSKLIGQLEKLRKKKRAGPGPQRWYGLKGGSNQGVYTDYDELRKNQKYGGGSYRRFQSKEEAEAFVEEGRRNPSLRDQRSGRALAVGYISDGDTL
ncbi:hypothetical protein M011DRAFT_476561 [Sporormia fimetaria CBS 119925]|uniref:Ribonuclease H1 N-terminal domain-containing protein n=1 Tax=Sporormia fimetaria CBS 119925 TaxID=1340428 RepID=A0A6A6VHI2_9PLEO|nr:hypothetical protein M011DRAFT_476561 [Sporormia fimetaria CBS 119925]